MKSTKSVKSKTTTAPSKSNAAQEELERYRSRFAAKSGEGEEREVDPRKDVFPEGVNYRVYLRLPGKAIWFIEFKVHYRLGPNQDKKLCLTPLELFRKNGMPMPATKCPSCRELLKEVEACNSKYERGDEQGRKKFGEICKKWKPASRYLSYTLDTKAEGGMDEVKVQEYGNMLQETFEGWFFDHEEPVDFADPENATVIKITSKKLGSNATDWKHTPEKTSKTRSIENYDELMEAAPPLEEFIPEACTVAEMKALIKGFESGEDTGDEEESEDTDSSEAPVKKRKPKFEAKKRKPAEEDEASEEEAEEEESEEDDEPEQPNCYGDADSHDPKDKTCKKCPFLEACAEEPEVAAKLKRAKKADTGSGESKKAKLKKKVG
jgi:hypothetical protein